MTYTTHKKAERLNHLISFKIGDTGKKQLDELITNLNIYAEKQSSRMRKFITAIYDKLNRLAEEVSQLQAENEKLQRKNRKLERFIEFASKGKAVTPQIQKTPKDLENKRRLEATPTEVNSEEAKRDFQQAKLRVPQKEANRAPLAMQKPSVAIEQLPKSDWVTCPDLDPTDWVRKSVECKKCRLDNFERFKDCWGERRKHPFGDLFRCSKPKPNL